MQNAKKITSLNIIDLTVGFMVIAMFVFSLATTLSAAEAPPIPAKDPAISNPPQLVESVRGVHPRLLINADEVARLKDFIKNDPQGQHLFAKLNEYQRACKPVPVDQVKFTRNDTDAQREGFWKLPTVALHYVLTGSEQSKQWTIGHMKVLLELEQWQAKGEIDCGMGAGNIMVGAALAYDWLYNDLDPEFRDAFRKKLIYQARRMYHLGHMKKIQGVPHYWQNDPHNNHRWHRNAGLSLAVLAAYEGDPADNWILGKTYEELAFIAHWLPEDGTSHESSSYLIFGGNHLMVAMHAADQCFGTNYMTQPFFQNVPRFRMHLLTPGLTDAFHFGDSGGLGSYNNFLFKCTGVNGLKDEQAGLMAMYKKTPKSFMFAWFSLLWYNPDTSGGNLDNLHMNAFFPDLGMAFARDSWREDGVGMMFKSCPYGGHRLNEYRNENNFHYMNVAHDDPDANSILLHVDGELIAETSRYAYPKLTSSHNTILVNGKGQKQEGQHWTQPGRGDISKMAVTTAYKDVGDVMIVEAEAGGAYEDLALYRRTVIWVKGGYILMLDDIRADNPADITWLMQSGDITRKSGQNLSFQMSKGDATCDFYVLADGPLKDEIVDSTANARNKPLGWKQVQLTNHGKRLRIATVFNPWKHDTLAIEMSTDSSIKASITVAGPGFNDAWKWQTARQTFKASSITGMREGGFEVSID